MTILKRFFDKIIGGVDFSISFGDCVTCSRKVRYGHRETAERAVVKMHEKGSKPLEAYRCLCCDGWHIGGKQ